MNLKKIIRDYLKEARVMQLATVKDGQPWICTVNYVFDKESNLYWMSRRSTRHSQELKSDSRVAGAIVKNPDIKRCLHFEGSAYEVSKENLEFANELYSQRYDDKPNRLEEAKPDNKKVRTYYILKPKLFVLFDEVNFPDNPRQEYNL
jgi:uncharacterized protein YhbP (UPF0306 family)